MSILESDVEEDGMEIKNASNVCFLIDHSQNCYFSFNFLIFTFLGTFLFTGETKRKFESVYAGGTMDTPESGKVFQYWHCCGSEDPFDPGCTAAPHASYDD
ncbi:hypothetical protein Gotur_000340 [Gossypium turneri]